MKNKRPYWGLCFEVARIIKNAGKKAIKVPYNAMADTLPITPCLKKKKHHIITALSKITSSNVSLAKKEMKRFDFTL